MGPPNIEIVTLYTVTALLLAVAALEFDCRERASGYYADPNDCNKYHRCVGIRAIAFSCGEGLHFNEPAQTCDWPEQVQCAAAQQGEGGNGTGFTPSCFNKEVGSRFRDPDDCATFYTCAAGNRMFKQVCRYGLVYNMEQNACDYRANVDCGENITDNDPTSCKYKVEGYTFGDAEDCTKYYQCSHMQKLHRPCAVGTAWDYELKMCVHPDDAKCTDNTTYASAGTNTAGNTAGNTTGNQANGAVDRRNVTTTTTTRRPPLNTTARVWTTPEGFNETEAPNEEYPACPRSVCYYTNWAQYRPGKGKFLPKDIDYHLCTHIIFAFAKISNGVLLNVEWNDQSGITPGMYEKVNNLKKKNTNLKTLLAVGGWNHPASPFHQVASSATARRKFVDTTIPYLIDNGFDGLDLDWEYPAHRGSPAEDKQHFSDLVEDLREGFDRYTKEMQREPFLLTAAVWANTGTAGNAYEIERISKSLDFINLMTYDFHGHWDKKTGHNSPLYPANAADTFTVDGAVKFYVAQGCPRNKLVVGMALYGQTFRLSSGSNTAVGAPASGGANAGPFTRQAGFMSYYEVCDMMAQGQTHWDDVSKVPYLVNGNTWVSYDSPRSLREKVRYVRNENLGGVMCWALDFDDFNDQSCDNGTYPLWTAVYNECRAPRSEAGQ